MRLDRFNPAVFALVLFLAGCNSMSADLPSLPPVNAAADAYRLGPGDKLKVTVFGAEDLSGDFNVGDNGMVSMPLVGDVKASGLTTQQLGTAMEKRLAEGYMKDPKVAVQAQIYRPFFIYGEVTRPGEYAYVTGMSVQNAIAMGGGYSYRANEHYVVVTRDNKDYRAEAGSHIMAGDVIRVPERYF
jgi:polysaccharide biosynthesis/export protein